MIDKYRYRQNLLHITIFSRQINLQMQKSSITAAQNGAFFIHFLWLTLPSDNFQHIFMAWKVYRIAIFRLHCKTFIYPWFNAWNFSWHLQNDDFLVSRKAKNCVFKAFFALFSKIEIFKTFLNDSKIRLNIFRLSKMHF